MKLARAVEAERGNKGFQPLGQGPLGLFAHGGVYPENWASRNALTKRGITGTTSERDRTRWTARSSGCVSRARWASTRALSTSPVSSTRKIRIIAIDGPPT